MFLNNWAKEEDGLAITTISAYNLNDGLNVFLKNPKVYDLILLDIRMPSSPEEQLFSGEDLGMRMKAIRPEVKIIVLTSLVDNHHLFSIFKTLNPQGILIKSDFDDVIFIEAVKTVLNNKVYYTESFNALIRHQFDINFIFRPLDRKILFCLNRGIKVKDLPVAVNISLSSIEKRLRALRMHFNIEAKGIPELLHVARQKGML